MRLALKVHQCRIFTTMSRSVAGSVRRVFHDARRGSGSKLAAPDFADAWHGDCVVSRPMSCNGQHLRRKVRPIWRAGLSALSTLALLFLMADDGISREEFNCEIAAVHLFDCCPALPANLLSCASGGCGSQMTPDLSEDRAACLQKKSCDELVALGTCDITTWQDPDPAAGCTPPCMSKVPPCQ